MYFIITVSLFYVLDIKEGNESRKTDSGEE